jgi:hypothetical protein
MRMAKVFGVQDVVAAIDQALLRRLLAVAIPSVAVAQQPLVVHLAQPFGLHRFGAAILNALGRLFADAAANR